MPVPSPLLIDTDDCCGSWSEAVAVAQGMGEEVFNAVALFRRLLGENWKGWRQGHHLAKQFFIALQGRLPEGARLARLLIELEGTGGLASVVRELGQPAWQSYSTA